MKTQSGLETLFPGYFAMVMATGIVSIDASLLGMSALATVLFVVNIGAYAVLWSLTFVRIACYPAAMLADLRNPSRCVTFLTAVAGTCILGNQFALLTSFDVVPRILWMIGALLWVMLIYGFFTAAILRDPKPSLAEGINGAWLLIVVSSQSVAVLGTLIAKGTPWPGTVLFVSLAMFLLGLVLYLLLFVLILYRWLFFDVSAEAMTPPYWINMGALAITTLAGARLLSVTGLWVALPELSPVIKTLTLYTIMVTGCIWEKVVFGRYLFAPAFFWEDVFSMLVLALHTAYLVALLTDTLGARQQMYLALAAYATYVINATQFILKLRAARLDHARQQSGVTPRELAA